jgi:superfamily II DNA or RNA helicase
MSDLPKAFLQRGLFVPANWVDQNPGILAHYTYVFKEKSMELGEMMTVHNEILTYSRMGEYYEFSRGDLTKTYNLFGSHFDIRDGRSNVPIGIPFQFNPNKSLKDAQKQALREFITPNIGGVIEAPPAFGKTVLMVAYISMVQQKTLIIVNKTGLVEQFIDRAREFSNLNELETKKTKLIGKLAFKKGVPITYPITVTTFQMFSTEDGLARVQSIANEFGVVFVDECHRSPAATLIKVISGLNPLIKAGVSATPEKRKDQKHALLPDLIGPVRVKPLVKNDCVVKFVMGQYIPFKNPNPRFQLAVAVLTNSIARNRKICTNVIADINVGHRVMILTMFIKHCDLLKSMLETEGVRVERLIGKSSKKERDDVTNRLNALDNCIDYIKERSSVEIDWDEILTWKDLFDASVNLPLETQEKIKYYYSIRLDCVVATSGLLGEGSDIPCLSSLHLVVPLANEIAIEQSIGRIQRTFKRKLAPLATYYSDPGLGIFRGCKMRVKKICEGLGYTIIDETVKKDLNDDGTI